MKLLLCAINAKFIHTNLAVYNLAQSANCEGMELKVVEYTINNRQEEILKEIYLERADIIAFSCYLWNANMVHKIAKELKKLCPNIQIWVGGPEVSYDAKKVLEQNKAISLVMVGEGEETMKELCLQCAKGKEENFSQVAGIVYKKGDKIIENPPRLPMNMDDIPFVYANLPDFDHKIIYYETSRGCPFSCSYCLSSIGQRVRFRSIDLVKKELQFFLDHKVKQVKFVDRTFNCKRSHSQAIWKYLIEHDNGITNFHFEIAADLLDESDLELFRQMRPGLIQLEIGVQSTHGKTIKEIRRVMDLEQLEEIVAKIKVLGNIHQHLDLIVGLPYEDYQTFQRSFNDVFRMKPDQLQLGFLKVLKGSYIYEKKDDYGIVYESDAPYEVFYTNWINYDEVLELKDVEEMVELYYNSAQYTKTLPYVLSFEKNPFVFFQKLAQYYFAKTSIGMKHARLYYYEILREFALEVYEGVEQEILDELLIYDLYLRENIKKRPGWIPTKALEKKEATQFYRAENTASYFPEMQEYDSKVAAGNSHVEAFHIDVDSYEKKDWLAVFNYHNRDPLTYDARVYEAKDVEIL